MTKHVGRSDPGETTGAAVATIAVVAVLGLVVAAVGFFRSGGGGTDPDRSAANVALATPSTATASSSQPPRNVQRIKYAETLQRHQAPQADGSSKATRKLRHQAQQEVEQKPTTFRVSTFNVLGASHTSAGGNKKGWADARTRMGWATSIVQSHDVDVVGFQEFESSQASTFMARTAGGWGLYPGNAGDSRNSIGWRKDTWELVEGATIGIPYFHGRTVQMPYVRLRNLASGQDVYFINVHNPATTGHWGNNQHWRDVATAREVALIGQLHAQNLPVVLTGDFNERDEAFCKVTGSGAMVAAAGGSAVNGGCQPPAHMGVDWIFGSSVIDFSSYLVQRTGLVQRATDHPFVVSSATIPPLDAG